jgi:hypothetical protein
MSGMSGKSGMSGLSGLTGMTGMTGMTGTSIVTVCLLSAEEFDETVEVRAWAVLVIVFYIVDSGVLMLLFDR